tara:strand:- start:3929 stop:4513 length:585 start_codon:yes stop_codon:yes gene_type:complete
MSELKIQKVKIEKVFENSTNPRTISKDKFDNLVESIKTFPEMLQLRPIVVNKEMAILGGNMRYKACRKLNHKEVFIIKIDDLTDEQIQEFIIKDNVGFGQWDWDLLANSWDTQKLQDWGMDVWKGAQEEEMFEFNDVENEDETKPKASDDNYSNFELVMVHKDKVFVLDILNTVKTKLNLKTIADALIVLAKNY